MEKQISIIIPTYNMEAYIGKCLDSLLIPELDQVEILVVNDGSKDRSSEIAHSYADRYPSSIRVIDKPNGNYGSCINIALPLCTGRYVKILDADDTFDAAAFSLFVNKLHECREDVIITNHVVVNPTGEKIQNSEIPSNVKTDITLYIEDVSKSICHSYVQMHRLAYRVDVFKRFTYLQTEGVSYTDSQWSIVPLAFCETFRCIDIPVYRYLIGREGQTMAPSQLSKFMSQFFIVLSDTLRYYQNYDGCAQGKEMMLQHIIENHEYVYFNALHNYNKNCAAVLKAYDNNLKNVSPDVYERLNHTQYAPEIKFDVFKYLREHDYPDSFSLPVFKRIELSLKVRLNSKFRN